MNLSYQLVQVCLSVYIVTFGIYFAIFNLTVNKKWISHFTFLPLATVFMAGFLILRIFIMNDNGTNVVRYFNMQLICATLGGMSYTTCLFLMVFKKKKWLLLFWGVMLVSLLFIPFGLFHKGDVSSIFVMFFGSKYPYFFSESGFLVMPHYIVLTFIIPVSLLIAAIIKKKKPMQLILLCGGLSTSISGTIETIIYAQGNYIISVMEFFFVFSITVVFIYLIYEINQNYKTATNLGKHLSEIMSRKDRELKETFKQRHEFLINLAHETKMPLTLISNYLEDYIDETGEENELKIIRDNVNKLKKDMVNFLDLEKIKKGRSLYDHDQICNLSELMLSKCSLMRGIFEQENIDFACSVEDDVFIRADPVALERIINNLLSCALSLSPGGVVFSLIRKDSDILLDISPGSPESSVESSAEGLDAEDRTFPESNELGLKLTKKIIEEISGKLIAKGSSAGVSFQVQLSESKESVLNPVPFQRDSLEDGDNNEEFEMADSPWLEGRPNLLIVENNQSLIEFFLNRFKQDFNIYVALNGAEALKKIPEIPKPDLILSEIKMDEMDGIEFFTQFQSLQDFQDVPFIFLTARDDQNIRIQLLQAGAVDYILKPFDVLELKARIESHLRIRRNERLKFRKGIIAEIDSALETVPGVRLDPAENDMSASFEEYHLTKREIDVVQLLFKGLIDKEIAGNLDISYNTVRCHIKNIYKKTGAQTRIELVRILQG